MALAMTLQEIRDFVRSHLDVDIEELPNALLDRFIQDGASRIERSAVALGGRWSFREVEYTLTVAANTQDYDLDAHADLITPAALAYIDEVRGSNWTLAPRDHRTIRAQYRASTTSTSANPRYWSLWGRHVYLWPKPSAATEVFVLGIRKQTDWIATNGLPDFPSEFHDIIASWALNRGYAQQDDFETAAFFREEFKETLRDRARPYILGNDAPGFQINGEGRPPLVTRNESGLPYTWEQ